MIRVFHLIKSLGRGGAETLLVQGLDCADRGSFEYGYGYFLPWKDQLVADLERRGSEVVEFTAETQLQCLRRATDIARYLREWDADLIHCHLPMASIAGRVAAKMVGIPMVSTEHNLLQRYHPATRLATLATWRLQDLVIAVSGEVQQSIHEHVGEVVPTRVVLNGVAVDSFRRDSAGGSPGPRGMGHSSGRSGRWNRGGLSDAEAARGLADGGSPDPRRASGCSLSARG